MSALVWPIAVVCFYAIVFATAVFHIRLAARDRQLEVQELEHEGQTAYEQTTIEAQSEQTAGHIPAMG
ncbi:MAG: hypothetical protein ACXVCX_02905 [Ktedonobacterales bacterium]